MQNLFEKPFVYDSNTGRWSLELQKSPKMFSAQCGIKLIIDVGTPTGETGEFYKADSKNGLFGSSLQVKFYDNLSGWTSSVKFDVPTLIKKLIEIMPQDKVITQTFCLAARDRKMVGEI